MASSVVPPTSASGSEVCIPAPGVLLKADLEGPQGAERGCILFAHGSGSSRFSVRNRAVARQLRQAGLATLLLDLLTAEEDERERHGERLRFAIPLLRQRLVAAIDWAEARCGLGGGRLGLFGASTGAAAALAAAAQRPRAIAALVSRGGRPDLAAAALPLVRCPVLLIVGGRDPEVLELNRRAARHLVAPHALEIVPGATHLFAETGCLDQVAGLAVRWFLRHLPAG